MKRKQGGMTFIGFVIVLAVAIFFVYCGMKVVPMYTEFYSVKKSLASLASEPGIANASKEKIRDLLFKRLYMSYANNVKTDALKMETTDSGYKLVVDYERREQLIANLDVVGKFHAEQVLARGAGAAAQ
ncbi:MAG TPA: DUF4845 domain-containing protein [Thermomonas sp.]|nr:DUF4845 domain-containing protein [Thermomonas sp.]